MNKKVVPYIRSSNNNVEKQLREIEDFIKNQSNWKQVDSYIDSNSSLGHRKEYDRLLSDLESDKFDIVVIKDTSRISRDEFEFQQFINKLAENKKQLYVYDSNIMDFYKG